jgi:hypothetical protein
MKSIVAFLLVILCSLAYANPMPEPKRPKSEPKPQAVKPQSTTLDAGQVTINVYGRPEAALPFLSSSALTDAMNALRERIKAIQAGMPPMPTLPPMPTMPTLTMPTYPTEVKLPVAVKVEGESYKFPTLPPVTVPEKFIIQRVEYQTPTVSPIRPIRIEYQDLPKPSKKS